MAMTPEADEIKTVAGHTFAYQRTLDKKVDLVIGSLQRQGERLARVERDIAEIRRDVPDLMLRPGARGFAIAQRRAMHGFAIVLEALRAFRPSLGHAVPGLLTLGIAREFRHALAIGGMAAKFVGWIDVVMDRPPLRGELRRRGSARPRHGCETPLRGRRAAASIGQARATPSCRPCPANPRRGEDPRWPVPDTHPSACGAWWLLPFPDPVSQIKPPTPLGRESSRNILLFVIPAPRASRAEPGIHNQRPWSCEDGNSPRRLGLWIPRLTGKSGKTDLPPPRNDGGAPARHGKNATLR